jgi:hypothetical protein
MFRIIENALTVNPALERKGNLTSPAWFDAPVQKEYQKQILSHAARYVSLDSMVGIEEWGHIAGLKAFPPPHIDKDELLYVNTEEIKLPLCSCIYYLKIDGLVGASLVIGNHKIIPESNMLVLLKPGVSHEITEYTAGVRTAIMINPWNYRIA